MKIEDCKVNDRVSYYVSGGKDVHAEIRYVGAKYLITNEDEHNIEECWSAWQVEHELREYKNSPQNCIHQWGLGPVEYDKYTCLLCGFKKDRGEPIKQKKVYYQALVQYEDERPYVASNKIFKNKEEVEAWLYSESGPSPCRMKFIRLLTEYPIEVEE